MSKKQLLLALIFYVFIFFSNLAHTIGPDSTRSKQPSNWFNLDYLQNGIHGVSTEKAYNELLKNKKSKTVIVAIIDSGVDIMHEDLKESIWTNIKEIPENGIDDDHNGYVDDVHGWDFLGGKDGRDIRYETSELTREYVRLKKLYEGVNTSFLSEKEKSEYTKYTAAKQKFDTKNEELKNQGGEMIISFYENYQKAKEILNNYLNKKAFTEKEVDKIDEKDLAASPRLAKAKQIFKLLSEMGLDEDKLQEAFEYFNGQITYGLNLDYNPRSIVGDDPNNPNERFYGNNEVQGPDARHGTHVAGIIAANRNNNLGIKGIADNVKIMAIRTVPDGDERDKDVANAIKYATENGAQIINMSFGKSISPQKTIVDEAVKMAQQKGVLFIHAAGNDNDDIDTEENYPTRRYLDGGEAENWIEVGASSWHSDTNLVAEFSNYGKKMVDLFAPGVDIHSSVPMNQKHYEDLSGTSMAAPVVTGIAALVWSYYPTLSATELKKILKESSVKLTNMKVIKPGTKQLVPFGSLSNTGGLINAYLALKMAESIINPNVKRIN